MKVNVAPIFWLNYKLYFCHISTENLLIIISNKRKTYQNSFIIFKMINVLLFQFTVVIVVKLLWYKNRVKQFWTYCYRKIIHDGMVWQGPINNWLHLHVFGQLPRQTKVTQFGFCCCPLNWTDYDLPCWHAVCISVGNQEMRTAYDAIGQPGECEKSSYCHACVQLLRLACRGVWEFLSGFQLRQKQILPEVLLPFS